MSDLNKEFLSIIRDVDDKTHKKGLDYYQKGKVTRFNNEDRVISGDIKGNSIYRASIKNNRPEYIFNCTCPAFARAGFCKHLVALVYAWSESLGERNITVRSEEDELKEYFSRYSKDELTSLVIKFCEQDETYKKEILTLVRADADGDLNISEAKKFIRSCFATRGFVDYRKSFEVSKKMDKGIDFIEHLFDKGHFYECLELSEYASGLANKACLHMDDSAGNMSDIFRRLEEIHFRSARKSKIDPIKLSKKLLALVSKSGFSQFWDCLDVYEDLLGEKGFQHFRNEIEKGWAEVPVKQPGSKPPFLSSEEEPLYNGFSRWVLERFMEKFAEESGDLDFLVSIIMKDQSASYNFTRVSKLYREAGQADKALPIINKAFINFKKQRDFMNLCLESIEIYRALKNPEKALEFACKHWNAENVLTNYRLVKECALEVSEACWNSEREKILDELYAGLNKNSKAAPTMIAAILCYEEKFEEAWEITEKYTCDDFILERLAKKSEIIFPEKALKVYMKQIDDTLRISSPGTYPETVKNILHIGLLFQNLGRLKDFKIYYESLTVKYKRLRKFMELLKACNDVNVLLGI
jgi:uncharacterized Zn finger protein